MDGYVPKPIRSELLWKEVARLIPIEDNAGGAVVLESQPEAPAAPTAKEMILDKEELLGQSDDYGTTGFAGIENDQFGLNDSVKSPIRVAMKLNHQDSMRVYEAIIPIRNILNNGLSDLIVRRATGWRQQ